MCRRSSRDAGVIGMQVYDKIAREMNAAQFERIFLQCREIIKKLKAEYRAIMNKKHKKTGQGRTDWEFF